MAPAPEARKKGGLDLKNPGAKEYIIVGGVVLGLALVYFWWKGKQAAPAAAPAGGGRGSPGTATGLSTGDLVTWMHDHASSPRRPRPRSHPVGEPGPGGGEDHDRDDRRPPHARMPRSGPPHRKAPGSA